MPELPEVETIRRGLESHLCGRQISALGPVHGRTLRNQIGGEAAFRADLLGAQVREVARRGKFLWLVLDNPARQGADEPLALVAHLGMSGQLLFDGPGQDRREHKHLRAHLEFSDGSQLSFIDQRTFGHLETTALCPTADGQAGGAGTGLAALPQNLPHIARDILDPALDLKALTEAARRRQVEIKNLLLAQNLVSGIGNIYADEALFAARLHPRRRAASISPRAYHKLWRAAQEVMERAILAGGTSFDALYVNADGESGYFERALQVYGRSGQACTRCGRTLTRTVIAGRSATYCGYCQKPR